LSTVALSHHQGDLEESEDNHFGISFTIQYEIQTNKTQKIHENAKKNMMIRMFPFKRSNETVRSLCE
jgi:hypothetical protein